MIDVTVLEETYSILKQFIPVKDRQEAADSLMSVIVEMISEHELEVFAASDPALNRAYKAYSVDEDIDVIEEDE